MQPDWFKQQRYAVQVNGKTVSECSFLLQASDSQGIIFDRKLNKTRPPIEPTFLLGDTFTTYVEGKPVSVLLATVEDGPHQEITFSKLSSGALLFLICAEPNIKVFIGGRDMKKKINRETGEVNEVEFVNQLEEAVYSHVDFLKEVKYLITHKNRAIAEGATAEELGCTEDALTEAKSQLLGNKPQKKTWKDFYKGE